MNNLLNISIDDVSPHPRSSIKVIDRCFDLIKIFPDIKFSLFVPVSYWRTIRPDIATKYPLQINFYPDFCNFINSLPSKNFEICYHGLHHGIPGKSDNDEFQNINYDQAVKLFNVMFEIVNLANLEGIFKNIFRPPAWRMSGDAIKAAKDCGIDILALSRNDYALKTYAGEDKNFKNVIYETCTPPFKPLKLTQKTEIVYHACEWDKNYLSKDLTLELEKFLKNSKNYKFSFLDEMI